MAQAERLAIQSDLAWVGHYNGAISGDAGGAIRTGVGGCSARFPEGQWYAFGRRIIACGFEIFGYKGSSRHA
jgi:hypothetical protein